MERSPWWPHDRFENDLPEGLRESWEQALRLADRGEVEQAVATLQGLVAEHPEFVPALSKLGALLAERGQGDEAAAWLEQALAADPAYPPALNNRGNLLLEAGDAEGAAALYRRALEVDADYATARHNLAVALKRQGDVEGFVREFKRSQRLRVRREADLARERSRRAGCLSGGAAGILLLTTLLVALSLWI